MSIRKPPESMTDALRRTIIESGIAYKSLSRETGVARRLEIVSLSIDERRIG